MSGKEGKPVKERMLGLSCSNDGKDRGGRGQYWKVSCGVLYHALQNKRFVLQILGSAKLAKLVHGSSSEGNTPRSPRQQGHAGDSPSDDEDLKVQRPLTA